MYKILINKEIKDYTPNVEIALRNLSCFYNYKVNQHYHEWAQKPMIWLVSCIYFLLPILEVIFGVNFCKLNGIYIVLQV